MSKGRLNFDDFPEILLKILSENDPNLESSLYLHEFQSLETHLERVNITYQQLQKYNLLPQLEQDVKDDTIAKKQWAIANKLFIDTHYLKALECYTRSIASAKSKEMLAVGYANRSACLYKMQLYRECITDIDRALAKNHYPADLKPKLLDRRNRAENLLKPPERFYQDIPKIPRSRRNPTIQCARNCVEIRKNRRFGRFVVATRDIQIGEVVCVERAYAAMPKEAKFIHCHHCLELCYNPFPCPDCTLALYCSEDCRNKAKKLYHKYLCPLVLTLLSFGMETLHMLAFKVICLSKTESGGRGEADDVYRSDRYKEIHELMSATAEKSALELLEKTCAAAILYHLLRTTTTFFRDVEVTEDDFKEILLLQIEVCCLNHLSVYENIQNEKQYDCEMFGVAVYSFCSLFNHSCCPNVDSVQYGSTNVLRATNTIPKGHQLFINYTVLYENLPVHLRQKWLQKAFYFTCKCMACEHNWVMNGDKTKMDPTLTDALKLTETEIYAFNLKLGQGNVEVARKFLPHVIPQFKKIEADEPFGHAWRMKDLISVCYRAMGNKRRI